MKRAELLCLAARLANFPHLKECGLIEAQKNLSVKYKWQSFPHLKECGLIEADPPLLSSGPCACFPHLKECGLIEAGLFESGMEGTSKLSALERVRPH